MAAHGVDYMRGVINFLQTNASRGCCHRLQGSQC
jgi:hypothetical protein